MARAATAAAGRFKALKLKLGGHDGRDVERVRAVRASTDLPVQVDVNEGWSYDEAVDNIAALAELGIAFVEQPLPAGDPDGPRLKERSRLPIVVDEDCHSPADVRPSADRAHGINIKLAKCGGIPEALAMIRTARELGLYVMLGCMGESSLGLAPAVAIASLCDHVDLDGNLPLRADPWSGVDLIDGVQVVSDAPGLGVTRR
jgi:L-alanine-DL-glutamate epimerase-like enolase superfamily enzyme